MALNVEMIDSWARMRKERKIFVGSMTDVFGEWVPDQMVFSLLDAMATAPRQTFQLLTKRPERMAATIQKWQGRMPFPSTWMSNNVWLGISAEDQIRLEERLIWLIRTPAITRFLSLEPLLGPVMLPDPDSDTAVMMQEDNPIYVVEPIYYLDWIIIGGESGPNARPMKLAWLEDILRQCKNAGIPAFVKQLGSHWAKSTLARDRKGGNPDEWPKEFRVRMFPGEVWR
jgi:protein gp37